MADFTSLRIDPNTYLGLSYNKYKSRTFKLALTNPEDYFTLREKVETKLQTLAIGALYDTLYFALKDGKEVDGQTDLGLPIPPNVPLQKINEICLSACETLNEIITHEVLELLLPIDYNKLMASRLADKGKAQILGDI